MDVALQERKNVVNTVPYLIPRRIVSNIIVLALLAGPMTFVFWLTDVCVTVLIDSMS